jgi:peptide/nickel transport system substrate-binding protein
MRRIAAPLIAAALALSGLVLAQGPTVLNAGLDVDAGTMDPRLARDTSAARMQELLYSGLVYLDRNLVPQPDLATSWEFISPTTLVFELRDDVTFHNGQPFTAEDVVYTFTTLVQEDFGAPRRSLYTPIESVEALDEHTVQFTLAHPYAPLLQYLDMGIVPHEAAAELGPDFGDNPVGTGPFRLESWEKGNRIEVAAFDDYYKGRPSIDAINISIIPDNNVRLIALESGDLDFIHSPVPPQELARLQAHPELVVETTTALGYTYLNLNLDTPALQDVRVRKALAHLSDKETISEVIFYGMDSPGESFLLPGTFFHTDAIATYEYDPERAMQLLEEAGWTDSDGDGIRDKDGQPLAFELTTNVDPNRQQILEFLQAEWAEAGIDASVRVYEWPSFIADVIAGEHQVALIGWLLLTDPDRATYLQFRTGGDSNYGNYSNPEVDRLLDEGRAATDPEERRAIYEQVAQMVTDEVPYIFLLNQGYVVMHDPGLEGFVAHPAGSWKAFESATFSDQVN